MMDLTIESEIRYVISIWEPYEIDLPEVKRLYLNKLRLCLAILVEETPVMQLTRAVINEVKNSA